VQNKINLWYMLKDRIKKNKITQDKSGNVELSFGNILRVLIDLYMITDIPSWEYYKFPNGLLNLNNQSDETIQNVCALLGYGEDK